MMNKTYVFALMLLGIQSIFVLGSNFDDQFMKSWSMIKLQSIIDIGERSKAIQEDRNKTKACNFFGFAGSLAAIYLSFRLENSDYKEIALLADFPFFFVAKEFCDRDLDKKIANNILHGEQAKVVLNSFNDPLR